MELKADDVAAMAKMIADIVGHVMSEKCETCAKIERDYINNLNKGPKQGDRVWGKNSAAERYEELEFMCVCRGLFVCARKDGRLGWFVHMTTADPYAIQYTLTAQEALVAIGQGKVVEDAEGHKYKWDSDGIAMKNVSNNYWRNGVTITVGIMYAIVEE